MIFLNKYFLGDISVEQENNIYESLAQELSGKDESAFEVTQGETQQLQEKYEAEKCDIQDTCKANLQELQTVLELVGVGQKFSPEEFKTLQMLLKAPKNSRDGELSPEQIQEYISQIRTIGFSGNLRTFFSKYQELKEKFYTFSQKEKKQNQPEGGKDGIWGQDTFWYMLSQNSEAPAQKVTQSENLRENGTEEDISETSIESGNQTEDAKILEKVFGGETQEKNIFDKEYADVTSREIQEFKNLPEYQEYIQEAQKLSQAEKLNFQLAVGATVDGGIGPESIFYYMKSPLKQAGFSVIEVAKLTKVIGNNSVKLQGDIEKSFGLGKGVLGEFFVDIQEGDYIQYDSNLGQMTIYDAKGLEKSAFDIEEGIFEKFMEKISSGDKEGFYDFFGKIKDKKIAEKFVDMIFEFASENALYSEIRSIFTIGEENNVQVDFRNNPILRTKLTAIHLFGDQEFIQSGREMYYRRENNFYNNKNKRLSIVTGTTIILIPEDAKSVLRKQSSEVRKRYENKERVEKRLSEVLKSQDIEALEVYSQNANDSERTKLAENIKNLVLKEKMFASLRLMLCDVKENDFILKDFSVFPIFNSVVSKFTPFDLFGDFKKITVNGESYEGKTTRDYVLNEKKLNLKTGDKISMQDSERRTQKDFEKLENQYPKLAEKFGNWVNTKRLGRAQGNCGRGVGDLCENYGIQITRGNGKDWDNLLDRRVQTGQFRKVAINHPSEAKPGGILCYNEGAEYGSSMRNKYGHVEVRTANGYCYDGFSSHPAGSANTKFISREQYMRDTAFTGYVYYPVRKA